MVSKKKPSQGLSSRMVESFVLFLGILLANLKVDVFLPRHFLKNLLNDCLKILMTLILNYVLHQWPQILEVLGQLLIYIHMNRNTLKYSPLLQMRLTPIQFAFQAEARLSARIYSRMPSTSWRAASSFSRSGVSTP